MLRPITVSTNLKAREITEGELVELRLEPPAQFVGRNASIRLLETPLTGMSRSTRIEAPSAAGGMAAALGQGNPADHKLPFLAKVHDDQIPEGWGALTLEQANQDEACHWYRVDTVPLTALCGPCFNVYGWIPLGWAAVPPLSNEMEIWISLKFTGPTYVVGSIQPDQVLIDRIVVVPPM